jgi:3D (Asp-Asp-Asp) domain-containing protein
MTILGALMGFLLLSGGAPALPAYAAASTLPGYAVTLTAYNAVPGQTDDSPFETASGAYSNPEVIAARSQDLAEKLPFGTIIELDGSNVSSDDTCGFSVVAHRIGYRVIEDAMNVRYTNRIDVLFDTEASYTTTDKGMKNAAQILGICKGIAIRVVGHVDINHIPKTQAELKRIVEVSNNLLALK